MRISSRIRSILFVTQKFFYKIDFKYVFSTALFRIIKADSSLWELSCELFALNFTILAPQKILEMFFMECVRKNSTNQR